MEINDLAGFSAPLTRLIEVIAKGVGTVTAPYLTRKNAEAKAHEIRVISDALSDVAHQHNLPVVYKSGAIELWQKPEDHTLILDAKGIDERSGNRLEYQARKEQANIESVTTTAAIELAQEESVSPEAPDDDWVTRFFKYAQDVSAGQMQDLWGRILAGEIRRPGTYALRTLDFVRNMTKAEAELLQDIGKLAVTWSGTAFIDARDSSWLATERKIHKGLHVRLAELDVLYPSELSLRIFRDQSINQEYFLFGNRILIVDRGQISEEIKVNVWKFTNVGMELLPLVPALEDDAYLERLALFFVNCKGKATIAQITVRHPDGRIEYQIVREVIAPETPKQEAR